MEEAFGCDRCWVGDADRTWELRRKLPIRAELVDDSHFIVTMLSCEGCGQRYISILVEQVDWVDGDDPQYWSFMPVTEAEADVLQASGRAGLAARLEEVAPGRQSLRVDYPKGGPQRIYWGRGLSAH